MNKLFTSLIFSLFTIACYAAKSIPTQALEKTLAQWQQRMHGYDGQGNDVTHVNMSQAGAAGAMVSTAHDIIVWMRARLPDQDSKIYVI